ncbi:MAG TPA: 2-dehydropantoate 2-reductase N-terminal domain-containing protein [Trebonia sp.]
MNITIIGAGAIGGTLGAHLIRAGHDITLCDADEAHVAAIRSRGLTIEGPVNQFTVAAPAITPRELPERVTQAIVAVKSLHTRAAAELLRGRLAPGGCVLTVQNGLTADVLAEAVGREQVISSFVNFGADVMGPGRIMQGNIGTFRVGELDGGRITPRVRAFAAALPYAEPTGNVLGFLWGKEAYGAMLWAGAVSDLTIAEHLQNPRYQPVMLAVAREVLAQAPVRVESFDGFEPDDLEGSLGRLAEFNRGSAKQYSGIYRDLVVRKRKTEIDEVLRDISGPVFSKVAEMIHDIEAGRRVNERANLDELAEFVAAFPRREYGSVQLGCDLVRRNGYREIGTAAPRSSACEDKRKSGGRCCQDRGPEGGAGAVCPGRPAAAVLPARTRGRSC